MTHIVKPVKTRSAALVSKAACGKELLENDTAVVLYKGKIWPVGELLQYLAEQVQVLNRKRCVPKTECIFKAEDYLIGKVLEK